MAEEEREQLVSGTILEAIRGRIANLNVVSLLADDTDCYARNSPGDAYAKNKCSIDLTGAERVLPPFMAQTFGTRQVER